MARREPEAAANPTVDYEIIVIDGDTYGLAWDFGALAEAEYLLWAQIRKVEPTAPKPNLLAGLAKALGDGGYSASDVEGLLFAAIKKAHPKMTLAASTALVRIDTLPKIIKGLGDAYAKSIRPDKDPTEGEASAPGN